MQKNQLEEVKAIIIRSDIKLGGITGAKVVGCDDGRFYVCKSPRFLSYPQPYLLANEQISKNLADLLGLPIQPSKIVNLRGEKTFGSLIEPGLKDIKTVRLTKANVKNWREVPTILLFDIFTCNLDRHLGNSLAIVSSANETKYSLRIMDHSHALMGASSDRKATLQDQYELAHYLNSADLNEMVEEYADFEPGLKALESLKRDEMAWAVQNIPADWLPSYRENCRVITRALAKKKDKLRKLLEKQIEEEKGLPPIRRLFPNLRG